MLRECCVVFILVLISGVSFTTGSIYQDTKKINSSDPLYSEDCLIDKALGNVEKNYDFSCLTDDSISAEQTKCCTDAGTGEKGCCPVSNVKGVGDPQKMIQIVTILVATTVALMIAVFVCTWCDKKTFPCLEKVEYQFRKCWEKTEEAMPCCDKKVSKRHRVRDLEEQGVPQYDIPMEYNQPIKDEFFGSGVGGGIDDAPVIVTSRP